MIYISIGISWCRFTTFRGYAFFTEIYFFHTKQLSDLFHFRTWKNGKCFSKFTR